MAGKLPTVIIGGTFDILGPSRKYALSIPLREGEARDPPFRRTHHTRILILVDKKMMHLYCCDDSVACRCREDGFDSEY
jgi:hypothetical protein